MMSDGIHLMFASGGTSSSLKSISDAAVGKMLDARMAPEAILMAADLTKIKRVKWQYVKYARKLPPQTQIGKSWIAWCSGIALQGTIHCKL